MYGGGGPCTVEVDAIDGNDRHRAARARDLKEDLAKASTVDSAEHFALARGEVDGRHAHAIHQVELIGCP